MEELVIAHEHFREHLHRWDGTSDQRAALELGVREPPPSLKIWSGMYENRTTLKTMGVRPICCFSAGGSGGLPTSVHLHLH